MPHLRRVLATAATAAALTLAGLSGPAAPTASAAPPAPAYTISIGATGAFAHPTDTPASPYIDRDGTFYFQQSEALYGSTEPRDWDFFRGTDFDSATPDAAISDGVNPTNPLDRNDDTTWRCDNSPTGLTATSPPAGSRYSQKNYCDLAGTWVDPDTGDWYGLVHNEFTPEPFGANSFSHYDAIDTAVSHDKGKTWKITGHALTSPYSTDRGDTTAFPQDTFSYGDGDQRLFVDQASGYFYVYYGSRVVPKAGTPGSFAGLQHVARAPMASKMATGSWSKWYDGAWSQPGVGGLESDIEPVTAADPDGWTPVAHDYNPANPGSVEQQIAAGTLPAQQSDLFIMNIAYDAYLGLYIGEPAVHGATGPQKYYVTDDLSTQKWTLIGDSGSYTSGSWYRWFLDGVSRTGATVLGKTFRSYCSIACATSDGEYADETITSTSPAAPPVDPTRTYTIGTGSGRVLAQVPGSTATTSRAKPTGSCLEAWAFTGNGDGSYRITNTATGQLLGVNSASTADRAWATRPTVTKSGRAGATAGQQWFVLPNTSSSGVKDGTFRLVNRYSGLVLGLSSNSTRLAETTPARSWTNSTGNAVGGTRTAAEQKITFTAVGRAAETVSVTGPGAPTGNVGKAVSLQITAVDSYGKALTYSASGLPAGLSISSSGTITGTPTAAGTSTARITASSGTANGTATAAWTIRIAQSSMAVKSVDSQETAGENGAGANVLDGSPATDWVTAWSATTAPPPHEIQLDLGRSYAVSDLYYLPRQDNANGRIAGYQIYVSPDGVTWGSPVATGTFPDTTTEQDAHFTPTSGRYVRLVALSEVNGNPWTAVAELNIAGG